MKLYKLLAFFIILFFINNVGYASNLVVQLNGELPKNIKQNILSHIGKLPNTELERSAFIYSVKDNTSNALQALGYYQASVNTTLNKEKWELELTIDLGKPTTLDNVVITINGDAKADEAFRQLLTKTNINSGDKLHHGKYEELKSDLIALGLQRGYFDGQLKLSNITIKNNYKNADITLLYDSGNRYKFGKVSFNDFELEPDLLSSLVPFETEQYYTTKAFHQLQQQLQLTQYFNSIIAIPGEKISIPIKHEFLVPIDVLLTPAKSHQFDFGAGYATDTEFRLSAGWRTPLLNKYGHFQETKIEYSQDNPTGRFLYSMPLSHPTSDLLQFKLSVENEDYADLYTKFISIQVGRVISENNWQRQIYARFHDEAWEYDVEDKSPNIIWDDKVRYFIPGVTWSRTIRTGSPLDPSSGFRQTYNIEGAHLNAGSDNSFFRVHGRWNYITTLAPKHRLVTRAELGAVFIDRDAELAPSLRFYTGGDQSIRGFAYQSIASEVPSSAPEGDPIIVGSTRLMVASIEYQYYLNEQWRMTLFSDGGSANNKGEFEPVYSFGSGVHYMSPVGPVRLDLAYGIDDDKTGWRLHINLGAEL